MENATFGEALVYLRSGSRIARSGWNGKGMWLILVPANDWFVSEYFAGRQPLNLAPWIGMKTADNKFVPWLASQTDILAEDLSIVASTD